MKKILAWILTVALMPQLTAFAETQYRYENFLKAETAEVGNLLSQCESRGIDPAYEKESYHILQWYISNDYMLQDEKKKNQCEASGSRCGKKCTAQKCELEDILKYNETALTSMCQKTRENLTAYLAGEKQPEDIGTYDLSNVRVSEDGILRDQNGEALFSVGYAKNENSRFTQADIAALGAENSIIEISPSTGYTINVAKNWVSKANGSNISYQREEIDGDYAIRIEKPTANGTFSLRQTVSVEAGKEYELSFYAKGSISGLSKINIYGNENKAWIAGCDIDAGYWGSNWRKKSYTFRPTVNRIDVEIMVSGRADLFYLDDANLQKTGDSKNLLSNPGFEEEATSNMNPYWMQSVLNALKEAKENNVSLSLLISPHYFPVIAGYENDTALYAKNSDGSWKTGEFIKFNIEHPKAKEVIEDYLRTLGKMISESPYASALGNIILTNESAFDIGIFANYFLPDFQEFLKDRYGDISVLNQKWQTNFSSFYTMYYVRKWCGTDSPGDYDTFLYNEKVFTEWHAWMAEIIREYLPDVMINAKPMNYLDLEQNPYWKIGKGADIAKFDTFSDLAGCDAYTFESYSEPADRDSMMMKMMWYDFLHTLTGKPVNNSEDHIIAEGDTEYSKRMRKLVYADLWQGAVHGRAISSVWNHSTHDYHNIYDTDDTNNYLLTTRPDCMEAIAYAGLDLRKNRDVLEEIAKTKPKAAIFYSKSSQIHVNLDGTEIQQGQNPGAEYLRQLFAAYQGTLCAGERAGFVSEDQPEQVYQYDLLIVPSAEHIPDRALSVLRDYIEKGGRVILANQCFLYDEYHNRRSDSLNGAIVKTAEGAEDYRKIVQQYLAQSLHLAEAETGTAPLGLEWFTIEKDGKRYLSLMNYNETEKNLIFYSDQENDGAGKDLLSGQAVSHRFTVPGLTPMLIEIGNGAASEVTLTNFSADTDGMIHWSADNPTDYVGASIHLVTANGCNRIASVLGTSFQGVPGATYEIRARGRESGTRITLGDQNTFSVEKGATAGAVIVKNCTDNLACGIAVMTETDENGKLQKRCSIQFTAGAGEHRSIDFGTVLDRRNVEIKVVNNLGSGQRLSNVIK